MHEQPPLMQLAGEHFFCPQDETLELKLPLCLLRRRLRAGSHHLLLELQESTEKMLQRPRTVAIGATQAASFEERLQRRRCCAHLRQDDGDDLNDKLPGGAAVARPVCPLQEQDEVHCRDDQGQHQYNLRHLLETDMPVGVEVASLRKPLILVKYP